MASARQSPDDRFRNAATRGKAPTGARGESTAVPEPTMVLAAYGTLAPGQSNHPLVASIAGEWHQGTIRGHTWTWTAGPYQGLPALRLDPEGDRIPVAVLVSAELPAHWNRLDDFEGEGYRRLATTVAMSAEGGEPTSTLEACVYEAINDPDGYDDEPTG